MVAITPVVFAYTVLFCASAQLNQAGFEYVSDDKDSDPARTCNTGDSECASPQRTMLFQKVLTSQKMISHDQSGTNTQKVDANRVSELQTEMKAFAEDAVKNRSVVSNVTRRALKAIKDEMRVMMAGINETHKEDQKEVNRIQLHLETCNTDIETNLGDGGSLHDFADAATTAQSEHDGCRVEEGTLFDDKDTKSSILTLEIDAPTAPACMSDFTKITLDNIGSLNECAAKVAEWQKWASETNKTLKEGHYSYETADALYKTKKGLCNGTQTNFESRFCDYASGLSTGCSTHATCLRERGQEKDSVDDDVRNAENVRKHQYVSAVHIICYVDVILLDNSTHQQQKMEVCKQLDPNAVSASHLDITYEQAPTASTCDETPIQSKPCDQKWMSQRYQDKTWNAKAPHDPCKACPAPVAPLPVPVEYGGARDQLIWELDSSDWAGSGEWKDKQGTPFKDVAGTPTKETHDDIECVRFDHDEDKFRYNLNLNPSAIGYAATYEVYAYVFKEQKYTWLLGNENGGCDPVLMPWDAQGRGASSDGCGDTDQGGQKPIVGAWNHIVAWWSDNQSPAGITDGSTAGTYVNGVKNTAKSTQRRTGGHSYLTLGSPYSSGHYADVCIRYARIYKKALTVAQVQDNFASAKSSVG